MTLSAASALTFATAVFVDSDLVIKGITLSGQQFRPQRLVGSFMWRDVGVRSGRAVALQPAVSSNAVPAAVKNENY